MTRFSKASDLLTGLRMLTIKVVEAIIKWRDLLHAYCFMAQGVIVEHQSITFNFLYEEENYLWKVPH